MTTSRYVWHLFSLVYVQQSLQLVLLLLLLLAVEVLQDLARALSPSVPVSCWRQVAGHCAPGQSCSLQGL